MPHSFCRRLSNAYRFNHVQGKLHYQPCCWVPYNIPITDRQSLLEAQTTITKKVELNFEKDCRACLSREKTNYRQSGRMDALKHIPDDASDSEAYMLEFQLDTECNAACAMCGPQFSSLWQKQLNIIPIQNNKTAELHTQFLDLISLDTVKIIRFLGGEPLLTKSHLTVISRIPDPSLVKLVYITNGSIFPSDKVLTMWSKFKSVSLCFSIDGINEQFEYIRWPLKWSRVSSNLLEIAKALPNSSLFINYTINPMNAWYVHEFEEYMNNLEKTNGINITKTYSPCFGDWYVANMPQLLHDELLKLYPVDHPLIGIINTHPPINDYTVLLNNMNNLDKTRGLNWRETFSRVAHHFK